MCVIGLHNVGRLAQGGCRAFRSVAAHIGKPTVVGFRGLDNCREFSWRLMPKNWGGISCRGNIRGRFGKVTARADITLWHVLNGFLDVCGQVTPGVSCAMHHITWDSLSSISQIFMFVPSRFFVCSLQSKPGKHFPGLSKANPCPLAPWRKNLRRYGLFYLVCWAFCRCIYCRHVSITISTKKAGRCSMSWTIASEAARERAYEFCRGGYQRGLIAGRENLSGSSLRGKAKNWGIRYLQSRRALLNRLDAAGLVVGETTGAHNARLLTIKLPGEK